MDIKGLPTKAVEQAFAAVGYFQRREPMFPRPKTVVFLSCAALLAVNPVVAQDASINSKSLAANDEPEKGGPTVDIPEDELIVRLRPHPGAPRPEAVVEAVNGQTPVPGGLAVGGPHFAEFLLPARLTGRMAQFYDDYPDFPRARLERSVVLHYPTPQAAHGVLTALENNPNVEFVEVNQALHMIGPQAGSGDKAQELTPFAGPPFDERITQKIGPNAVVPNDPFFAPPVSNDPTEYQWGSYAMRLPDAWQYVRGHAKVLVIDIGLQIDHPDLKPFGPSGPFIDAFIGGNYREHLSFEYGADLCTIPTHVHGTHTTGIVAATPDNGAGVAGACWHCPIAMASFGGASSVPAAMADAAQAITEAGARGVQVITMSFGILGGCPSGSSGGIALCNALDASNNREIVLTASSGNDLAEVELPGTHQDVAAVGAVNTSLTHWTRITELNCDTQAGVLGSECGSNYSISPAVRTLDLTAPGQFVLSTVWIGNGYQDNPPYSDSGCGDQYPVDGTTANDADGYGACTGTSMSSPYLAGVFALLRTANPLLTRDQLRTLLIETASGAGSWDQFLGYGVPDAAAGVEQVFGTVGGQIVGNRATPMFRLYSSSQNTHLFTTSPQAAVGEIEGVGAFDSDTASGLVPGYATLPGDTQPEARAAFYLFTSPQSPDGSATLMRPLYRLTRDRSDENPVFCGNNPATAKRSWGYTTSEAAIRTFHTASAIDDGVVYFPEGIEGYIYATSATPPTGAEKLIRYFNRDLDDWLLLLESETPPAGYDDTLATAGGAPQGEWLGWVLPNVDTDGDGLIDAWESILGTSLSDPDSDGDNCTDGEELLGYIKPAIWEPSDPLDGICAESLASLFADGFESGNTSAWSSSVP